MKIDPQLTDDVLLKELGERIAATRIDLNLTQADLAEQAGLSKRTIERLENGAASTQLTGFIRVCRVLGLLEHFETLLPQPQPGPMAQLKQVGHSRQRASGRKSAPRTAKPWTWGESS